MFEKLIYAIICSIVLPIIVVVNLKSAGAEPYPANILSSIGIGFVAGFVIGSINDRWKTLKNRLEYIATDRTEKLAQKAKELETSQKQAALLRDLLPVCPSCRSIRVNDEDWQQPETCLQQYSAGTYSTSLCPDCSVLSQSDTAGHQLGQQPATG